MLSEHSDGVDDPETVMDAVSSSALMWERTASTMRAPSASMSSGSATSGVNRLMTREPDHWARVMAPAMVASSLVRVGVPVRRLRAWRSQEAVPS